MRVGLKRPAGGASGEAEEIRLVLNGGETALSGRECFFWSVNDWETWEVDVFEIFKMHPASLETVSLANFRSLQKKNKKKTHMAVSRARSPCCYLNMTTHTQLSKIK